MNGIAALGVLLALVAVATAAGLVWRATTGRARSARREQTVRAEEVGAAAFGERATLLQFTTEFCALCPATARVLDATARSEPGVAHVEVDLTTRPDLAHRFAVLQTPTTLVLDGAGSIRARIGGAARPADVRATLDRILGSDHVSA
ncbi:TlpA family protein disulfide reductase [Leifsonia aquatica]|jgi:thiol-disulfide isomerase/thioredoxin|uniref:Thiol-disulfide isomerase/thioredoxin n=1 Tax=Leifsonia aquatica TaxID=144185 RepID=A0A7W4YJP9_LEIAQ|nr:thioredoxin family protein [Leifsonia aquatica]MBB2966879.1 thiol-disulfide isomerase/thioredoxin [Leifsonia aquatica]